MRLVMGFGVAALAAGIALTGCQVQTDLYPAPPPCEGPLCGNSPSGGGGIVPKPDGGSGAGGTGGTGSSSSSTGGNVGINQIGTVTRLVSPSFDDTTTQVLSAAATIFGSPNGGNSYSTPYDVATGKFTLTNVPSGPTWFLVQDESSGAADILSTISFATLPVLGNFSLPVIDRGTMQTIALSLPTVAAQGISSLAAQVILVISHANAPYKGVKVTGGAGGAKIAYDNGAGYTDSTTAATGTRGTVILFNAGLSSPSIITVTDTATQNEYDFPVQTAPGTVTIAGFEIQ